jgi:HAD superfamily hydrolase (TIGR01509 family)
MGNRGMISTLFLDNDGVLVDTEKYYFEANRDGCKKYGYHLTEGEYRKLFLTTNGGIRAIFESRGWSRERIDALRAERDKLYAQFLGSREIEFPGVRDGLERLAERFDLCMVTSSPRFCLDIIHGRTGYMRHFARVVCEQDVTRHKPDPEPYLVALKSMNVAPDAGLAIEDSERGVRSATAAGLRCIAIPQPLTRNQDFSGALAIEPGFAEAVRTIERIAGKQSEQEKESSSQ